MPLSEPRREVSRSDIERCRGQVMSFNKRSEELRAEIKALDRSKKDFQGQRDQIEKQMRCLVIVA